MIIVVWRWAYGSPQAVFLTNEEIASLRAGALGIDESLLRFNSGDRTGFVDFSVLVIGEMSLERAMTPQLRLRI